MAQTFLNLAQGVTGTLPTGNYVQGGIQVADQWRLANNTSAGTNINPLTDLERVNSDGFGKIGTGMTVSSGIFTFPNTGIWQIEFFASATIQADDNVQMRLQTTTDYSTGPTWSSAANIDMSGDGSSTGSNASSNCFLFDVTDVAERKCKFMIESVGGNSLFNGNNQESFSSFTFTRLGDT